MASCKFTALLCSMACGLALVVIQVSAQDYYEFYNPKLTLDQQTYYVGQTLEATCELNTREPKEDIRMAWFLGSRPVTGGLGPYGEWSVTPGRTNVVQKLVRTLRRQDHGKILLCVARHRSGSSWEHGHEGVAQERLTVRSGY